MPLFAGKTWFRNNIQPYLTKIKDEIANSGGGGGDPPLVYSTDLIQIPINVVTTITVTGDFFSPSMVITCGTATISNYVFTTQQSCTFDIISATAQTNVITYTNSNGSDTSDIDTIVSNWVDLRTGGSSYTESHDPGTTITQDADGLSSNGSLWSNWIKFTSHSWQRSTLKKVSIIMRLNGNTCMMGIYGNEQVESSTAQYFQAEIQPYFNSSSFSAFYGTTAAHTGASQSFTGLNPSGPYFKIVFENNGEPGALVSFYNLANLTDFDAGTLIGSRTVASNMDADSTTLYVGAILGSSPQRIVAFLVEDM